MDLNEQLKKLGLYIEYDPDFMDGEYTIMCSTTGYHIHVGRVCSNNEEDFVAQVFRAVADVIKYRNDPNVNGFLNK